MIYFIQAGEDGPIKIGYTSVSAKARVSSMQTGHYVRLHVRACILGSTKLETSLHRKFSAHRLEGEWFSPASALLEFIHSADKVPEDAIDLPEYLTSHRTPPAGIAPRKMLAFNSHLSLSIDDMYQRSNPKENA